MCECTKSGAHSSGGVGRGTVARGRARTASACAFTALSVPCVATVTTATPLLTGMYAAASPDASVTTENAAAPETVTPALVVGRIVPGVILLAGTPVAV